MNSLEEKISRIIIKVIDVLLLKNPERTVLGVAFGAILAFCSKLFFPALKKIDIIDIERAPIWGWIPIGIIITYFPLILWKIINKPRVNDEIDELIRLIEHGNFTETEKRLLYRNLINQCISNVTLKKSFSSQISQLSKELND